MKIVARKSHNSTTLNFNAVAEIDGKYYPFTWYQNQGQVQYGNWVASGISENAVKYVTSGQETLDLAIAKFVNNIPEKL